MSPDGHRQSPSSGTPAESPPSIAADERSLVEAILRRDRKAMAEFVDRHTDPVYAYVRHRLLPRTDLVDDVVQDVFLAALEGLSRFTGESSLRVWLLGIARHKVEDCYRARLREPESMSELDHDSMAAGDCPVFEEMIDRARLEQKTSDILRQLPVAYSVALLWRYWELRSTKDMAASTGKTEKAIERILARARAHFKQLWEGS